MAKTLLEFEGELFDVMAVFRVTRKQIWNERDEQLYFCIVFNEDMPDKFVLRDWVFPFKTQELRDKKFLELKNKIAQLEHINIL
jgi:hypothetical protein